MDAYELISPKSGKPCGVFACGVCNMVTSKDLVERCCRPCECGKEAMTRFGDKCISCCDMERRQRMVETLEKAELVDWDGSMIFSEDVSGYRNGWFDSPEGLLDYIDRDAVPPEFAFLGRKCVSELDIDSALEAMAEDTYEDAELNVSDADMAELKAAVCKFNNKYAITYYEHDYKKKVRV